jgi:hypothetical protein
MHRDFPLHIACILQISYRLYRSIVGLPEPVPWMVSNQLFAPVVDQTPFGTVATQKSNNWLAT